jgi:hypothetical protein
MTARPQWMVSLDLAGPCERGERPYYKHSSKAEALAEARRLAHQVVGKGRFGVFELAHVVGWIDEEIPHDDGVPF